MFGRFIVGQKQTVAAGAVVCAGMPKPQHACQPNAIAINGDDPRGPGM
jgi:hypothetical protein